MVEVPQNYELIGNIMTNFDHSIKKGADERLKKEDVYGEYTGWNFFGNVWWNKVTKKFMCMVKQYSVHVDTIASESLEGVMDLVSDQYGHE